MSFDQVIDQYGIPWSCHMIKLGWVSSSCTCLGHSSLDQVIWSIWKNVFPCHVEASACLVHSSLDQVTWSIWENVFSMLSQEGSTTFPLHERSIHCNINNLLTCIALMEPCLGCNHDAIYYISSVLSATEVTSVHRTDLLVKIYITM